MAEESKAGVVRHLEWSAWRNHYEIDQSAESTIKAKSNVDWILKTYISISLSLFYSAFSFMPIIYRREQVVYFLLIPFYSRYGVLQMKYFRTYCFS